METTQPMNLAVGGENYSNPSLGYNGGAGEGKGVLYRDEEPRGLLYRIGNSVGNFFKTYGQAMWSMLLVILLVGVMVSMWVNTIADIEVIESNATMAGSTAAYMNVMYHQRCKSRGGCSKTCPFISEDDPRVVIFKQMENIDMLYGETKQAVADNKDKVINALSTEKTPDSLKVEWEGIIAVGSNATDQIRDILNQLKDLDKQYSDADSISIELINAKNRAVALGAAAIIQKNILFISTLHLYSKIMMQYITSTSPEKQKKIMDYDERVRIANIAAGTAATSENSIAGIYKVVSGEIDGYAASKATVSNKDSTAQDIVSSMSKLMTKSEDFNKLAVRTAQQIYKVADLHSTCENVREAFSNDLPGKMDADKVTSLIEEGDYETAIIKTALESDIVANHQKFAKERSSFESGGGIQSVTDHDPSIGNWVGLFGRPSYRKSDGTSAELSKEALKSIPSEYPSQMMSKSSIQLGSRTY